MQEHAQCLSCERCRHGSQRPEEPQVTREGQWEQLHAYAGNSRVATECDMVIGAVPVHLR
jgi:hypothetical protein